MSKLPYFPFDPERAIGTVIEVGPTHVRANLPAAAAPHGGWIHGQRTGRGEVGEFVIIECGNVGILGRVTFVGLPERDRLTVEPTIGGSTPDPHPVGKIQMLSTVDLESGKVTAGVTLYPRLGSRVYSISAALLQWIVEAAQDENRLLIDLGTFPGFMMASVRLTPERLFGRHCAILGATGGGKSWTIARLIEQVANFKSKVLLIDATGEFFTLKNGVRHVYIGLRRDKPRTATEVVFPYWELEERDLLALFRPSGQAQTPKLRDAIRSLKLIHCVTSGKNDEQNEEAKTLQINDGCLTKTGLSKKVYEEAYRKYQHDIEKSGSYFDILKLAKQIELECVYPSGKPKSNESSSAKSSDHSRWGETNPQELNYCLPLISRIDYYVKAPEFSCIFQPGERESVSTAIRKFMNDKKTRVLRVSLKHLSFKMNVREVVVDAIGRLLLSWARDGMFSKQPLVVFIDEAHQFLNKTVGEDYSQYPLDAFELIAKEGRKYKLTLVIATQRPRDLPEGVLSQVGTMIVHRLTNDRDREIVERACGDMDRSAASFLPTLGQGEAVIVGVDFQFPVPIKILPPGTRPESEGPDYQKAWDPSESVGSPLAEAAAGLEGVNG